MHLEEKDVLYTKNIFEWYRMEIRMELINRNQIAASAMLKNFNNVYEQVKANDNLRTGGAQTSPKIPDFLMEHDYAGFNMSAEESSLFSSISPLPQSIYSLLSSSAEELLRFRDYSAKRKLFDEELDYHEFSARDEEDTPFQQNEEHEEEVEEYPKQIDDSIILGPNGTEVDMRSYNSIIWSSAASATRQLLGFVFSSDILATHTLTGKPSPAFYGRERPAKMQLDPIKAADIIHCVRSKFKCTKREIRAAITTKCSDTSKKYKRRHQKQLQSLKAAL